jgi:acetate kinase
MSDTLLVLNTGSSSIKFQLFAISSAEPSRVFKGQIEGIGTQPRMRVADADGTVITECAFASGEAEDVASAMSKLREWLGEHLAGRIPAAVGHRVVHGGPDFDRPVLIDEAVLVELERYVPLAPLHQPNNLAPIKRIRELLPEMKQVACFDTAFHRGHGGLADRFAIPERLYAEGVRRYGFHGLSYEFIARRLRRLAPGLAEGRVVVAHLGSGASLCALKAGRSVDSTMGFTALDGLPMGTRPGQIDPGVLLYLMDEKGMSGPEISDFLYRECGLKGLSGISNDMRDLLASDDPRAALAVDFFCYRAAKEIAGLAAVLEGLDGLVFTAGIGEHAPEVRAKITARLGWLGVSLDAQANAAGGERVDLGNGGAGAGVAVCVIPTDEELMIARHTLGLLETGA